MAEEKLPHTQKSKRDWRAEGELPYDRIPAFKAAYDCYKECQFRFRNVPADAKSLARAVKTRLLRVMVCIAHARLNIRVLPSLSEAVDFSLETQVILRVLVDTNALSKKDFANITKYSENLVRQMVGWSVSEEKKRSSPSAHQPLTPSLFDNE